MGTQGHVTSNNFSSLWTELRGDAIPEIGPNKYKDNVNELDSISPPHSQTSCGISFLIGQNTHYFKLMSFLLILCPFLIILSID